MIQRSLRRAAIIAMIAATGCGPTLSTGAGSALLDRTVMPSASPTPEYDFPEIQRHTLSNGLPVWLVERSELPVVNLGLLLDAGAVAEPPGRPGLASLTAAMLTAGTTTRTATEIADEIDFLAVTLAASAGRETATVGLGSLSRNLAPALEILADVVVNPAFAENEWVRVRDQRLGAILQSRDRATTIATEEFDRRLFGEGHPYGRALQGTAESVRAMTSADPREFHRAYYVPGNAHLIVVGDVSARELLPLLETAFRDWRGATPPAVEMPADPRLPDATRVYLIDKPVAAQSEIRIGHVGVPRSHPDFFPLLVMNSILGGQFTSRINLNLREDKGYTYGARSAFQMAQLAGPFTASAGVQTEVTRESLIEFMRELEDIREGRPITEEEIEFARASIIRGEPLGIQTNAQIASRVQQLIAYDLPLDYFDSYNDRVAAVTLDEVNRVARDHIQPDRFTIVVVGDLEGIEAGVRTLPYPVEVVPLEQESTP